MRTMRDGIAQMVDKEIHLMGEEWRNGVVVGTLRMLKKERVVQLLKRRDAYWRRRVQRIIKAQRRIYVARQASARARDNSDAEAYWAHKALATDDLLAALKETP